MEIFHFTIMILELLYYLIKPIYSVDLGIVSVDWSIIIGNVIFIFQIIRQIRIK